MRSTTRRNEPAQEINKNQRGPASSRTILGDITNTTNIIDNRDGSKKTNQGPRSAPVELKPYMDRPVDDIDSKDAANPALASTYVNDMYLVFHDQEREFKVNWEYMRNQNFVNDKMRCILVDWLVEVHLKFKMVPETLYLTVSIIDRFLERKEVRRSKLQLVGVASLLIASKYEEIFPPPLKDLVYITDRAYDKREILDMENEIINELNFNFTIPTTHTFLCRFLKAAHADRPMVQMACYLTERTLQEYPMLRFLPSVIAATAVMIARKSLHRHPWSPTLLKYTTYDECDIMSCAQEMQRFLTDPTCQQLAVKRKYSSSKFGGVGSMPLNFE